MYSKIIYKIVISIIYIISVIYIINNFHNKNLDGKEIVTTFTGKTMGTYWQVKIPNLKNKIYIKNLIEKCLYQDEKMLSSWEKDSLVSKFNRLKKNQLQIINKKFYHLILSAFKINRKTYGKLDITISRLINIWGFGIKKKPNNFPSLEKIKKNINLSGSQHIKIIRNSFGIYITKDINDIEINLSTFGEGFATDHVSYILKKKGIKNYIISVGGTVLVKSENHKIKPKIIAIQKPIDQKKSIHLLVHLKNNSISTAGTYRNYYYLRGRRISHLIDANTGQPITHNLVSVSVISSTALEADSWDTGLLILGFKKAKKLALKEQLAVCLITQKNDVFSTWTSPKFQRFLIK